MTVAQKRAAIRDLVGGRHAATRLSKGTLVRAYYALAPGGRPLRADAERPVPWYGTRAYRWSDRRRRVEVADLAGFEYDPGPVDGTPRSYNSDELDALVEALREAVDDEG